MFAGYVWFSCVLVACRVVLLMWLVVVGLLVVSRLVLV